ncbi:hypothetical protein FA13DRAFT_1788481 [Coprinellus micaceus]|uniref:Uncharacterized protein n=1 Tax=Coprinellus micaceus TaxID=71717 RepID=A0A4Y7TLP3_COPMI|nr:hypothetical protein FA13DRAFT_1788481 [Coprinellus micaceus]
MSEDRWDFASLSPLTSLSGPSSRKHNGSSSPGSRALPLTDQADGGSALSGLNRSAVLVRPRPPFRIPPRRNPARRGRVPQARKSTASKRSPSLSEDEHNYSDMGSEWGGIMEDNPSGSLLRSDGMSSPSSGDGLSSHFGLGHQDEDLPMGLVPAQGRPTLPVDLSVAGVSAPSPMSESPTAPAQDSPAKLSGWPSLHIPPQPFMSEREPAARCPLGGHSSALSRELPADQTVTELPKTPAPLSPALSIPTSPTHISVWESSPPPDVYYNHPITRQEMISSISQRHERALPGLPTTSGPLSDQQNPGNGPPSPAYSNVGLLPGEMSSSVQSLQERYQALYEEWVDLETLQAMMERQLEHLENLGRAMDLNEAIFA